MIAYKGFSIVDNLTMVSHVISEKTFCSKCTVTMTALVLLA